MRTCNHQLQWCNQPLRLTEEEMKDPLLVLKDFFECYHLNDTREMLWNWTVEVLTSSGSISSEPLERSNHLYFYEKMETLIEACYMILQQARPQAQPLPLEISPGPRP
ncbi:hypothetical protein [Longitalea luteola]|uniref:hypothetical protein n=1 Tax=Longitalea luteola TaxID=2812563 RepID=UPI001A976C2B|nr:hypothetical protein [Longitalea luteola]